MFGRISHKCRSHRGDGRTCRVQHRTDRAAIPDATAAGSRHRSVLDAISREAEPGLYTKAFVAEAIRHYNAEGRDATIAHYNSPESMDGEWYLFIINEEGLGAGAFLPSRKTSV